MFIRRFTGPFKRKKSECSRDVYNEERIEDKLLELIVRDEENAFFPDDRRQVAVVGQERDVRVRKQDGAARAHPR